MGLRPRRPPTPVWATGPSDYICPLLRGAPRRRAGLSQALCGRLLAVRLAVALLPHLGGLPRGGVPH
eukprot:11224146-Lingulodinium_polyedra.AAC.1